jgi:hypothetical protein
LAKSSCAPGAWSIEHGQGKARRREPAGSPLIAVNASHPHADVLYLKQDLMGSAGLRTYITIISLGVRYGAMRISGRWGISDHKET